MQKRTAEALTGHHAPPTFFWGQKSFPGQVHLLYLPPGLWWASRRFSWPRS